MALGEYVSVSSQSDSQKAFLRRRIASQTEAEEAAHLVARGGVVSPWSAAGASALAFLVGGVLPLIAVLVPPPDARVWVTFVVVVVALAAAGLLSARLGGGPAAAADAAGRDRRAARARRHVRARQAPRHDRIV